MESYSRSHQFAKTVSFLKANQGLVEQSNSLEIFYAWALYYEGLMIETVEALERCEDTEDPNYRELQINLAIGSGDWESIASFIIDEHRLRDDRKSRELLRFAGLAVHIGSGLAKDLLLTAVEKGEDDAAVLANAYFLATQAGLDNDPDVSGWLKKAAELSGEGGPIKTMSLQDVFDQKPDWDRRVGNTSDLLAKGNIPIFGAAISLNRTLVSMISAPALTNLSEIDPRRRSVIPAFSGKRSVLPVPIEGTTATFRPFLASHAQSFGHS